MTSFSKSQKYLSTCTSDDSDDSDVKYSEFSVESSTDEENPLKAEPFNGDNNSKCEKEKNEKQKRSIEPDGDDDFPRKSRKMVKGPPDNPNKGSLSEAMETNQTSSRNDDSTKATLKMIFTNEAKTDFNILKERYSLRPEVRDAPTHVRFYIASMTTRDHVDDGERAFDNLWLLLKNKEICAGGQELKKYGAEKGKQALMITGKQKHQKMEEKRNQLVESFLFHRLAAKKFLLESANVESKLTAISSCLEKMCKIAMAIPRPGISPRLIPAANGIVDLIRNIDTKGEHDKSAESSKLAALAKGYLDVAAWLTSIKKKEEAVSILQRAVSEVQPKEEMKTAKHRRLYGRCLQKYAQALEESRNYEILKMEKPQIKALDVYNGLIAENNGDDETNKYLQECLDDIKRIERKIKASSKSSQLKSRE